MNEKELIKLKVERFEEALKGLGRKRFIEEMAENSVIYVSTIRALKAQVAAAKAGHMEKLFKGKPVRSVIIYENRKSGRYVFPETDAGYMALFKILDREWRVYTDLNLDEIATVKKELDGMVALAAQLTAGTIPQPLIQAAESITRNLDAQQRIYKATVYNRTDLLAARKGDVVAAKRLLNARSDYEYEKFTVESIMEAA